MKFNVETITAAEVDRALSGMNEIDAEAFWAPAQVRAYNRAGCESTTVRDAEGWHYHVSLAAGAVFAVEIFRRDADGMRYFVRAG